MQNDIKAQVHKLVDDCNDEFLLNEAKVLLASANEIKDWWDELTEEDRNLIKESEVEYKKGNFISNQDLIQQFEEWKKK